MVDWKEQLIEYINSLDDAFDAEVLNGLLISKIDEIKTRQVSKRDDGINDNSAQLVSNMKLPELIKLYRSIFYGRQDVFAVRWENETNGKHGYAPKCKNEWNRQLCGKAHKIRSKCISK